MLLCFALLEGLSLLLGLGLSEWLSDLLHLPDPADGNLGGMDHGHAGPGLAGAHGHGHSPVQAVADSGAADGGNLETTTDSHGGGGGFLSPLLSWLEIGKVPVLISLCVFLAAFSIGGMTLQQALLQSGMPALREAWAGMIAFFAALPVLKFANRILGRMWPKDETSAFPVDHLVGWVGVVTIGTASEDRAAEVRVIGPDRRPHYVMCRVTGESVGQGGEVLLLNRDPLTGFFRGKLNSNPDLSPRHFS